MSCDIALNNPKPAAPDLPIVLVAAVALINPENKVLIAQRPEHKQMGGLWEFPGGKVDEGEVPEFALMRELEEELGIETRPSCYLPIPFIRRFSSFDAAIRLPQMEGRAATKGASGF